MTTQLTIAVSALALIVAAAPSSANAADIYSSAKDPIVTMASGPANWTGFYLGVNGGYGEGMSSRDSTRDFIGATTTDEQLLIAGADLPTGFLFGGQVGYLYQPQGSNFVFGGEFSFDGTNISGDKIATGVLERDGADPHTTSMHQQLDWVGTVTGVGGLTLGNAMVFVKGGLAFGKVQENVSFAFEPVVTTTTFSRSSVDTGWTAGAGVAYKIAPNWSFGIEWDYFDLGSHSLSPVVVPTVYQTTNIAEDFWVVKANLNYHVGNVYQPLK